MLKRLMNNIFFVFVLVETFGRVIFFVLFYDQIN